MPLIQLETKIEAPQEQVFDLARSIDAHMASTVGTHEKAVDGRTSGLIGMGETVTWEAKHFGVRQRLTVKITSMDRPHVFGDEMISGAFSSMKHVHRFSPNGTGTVMRDEFHFSAPLGVLGRIAEWLFLTSYMTKFLQSRSRALKELAESEGWQRYLPSKAMEATLPTMSTEQNPHEPTESVETGSKPAVEVNPYWGRTSVLDWYSSLGMRGRLRWIAGILLSANAIAYTFGFFWPRMLIGGVVALLVSFLLPGSIDD